MKHPCAYSNRNKFAMIAIFNVTYYYYVVFVVTIDALHFHYVTGKVNIITIDVQRVIYYCQKPYTHIKCGYFSHGFSLLNGQYQFHVEVFAFPNKQSPTQRSIFVRFMICTTTTNGFSHFVLVFCAFIFLILMVLGARY